jgi:hypothetical protein
MGYAAGLAPEHGADYRVSWVETPSGARLAFVDEVVVKRHRPGTDRGRLSKVLAAVGDPPLGELFVPPLSDRVDVGPAGSAVTAWPKVAVLSSSDPIPWREAGHLLARLHRTPIPASLPMHDETARLDRAIAKVARLGTDPDTALLHRLGTTLRRELTSRRASEATVSVRHNGAQRHTPVGVGAQPLGVVHGDWHLGQLGRWDDGWRLLDVDDLGVGDPAWDHARPAGFWAAGLLDDASWRRFLDAYRAADGPAVPGAADPWPRLDLPARVAVVVAAVRALTERDHEPESEGAALLNACRRM